jgi:hypothetical protein
VASLRELQHSFAAALRDPDASIAVRPAANLDVYRHNSEWQFRAALEISFPVLRQRVGDDYFRQLAHHYRLRFPSRSGDLQWAGRDFANFLDVHLSGDYAWLADLARLEWARELASIAETLPALSVDALSRYEPGELERLRFRLQPALQLVRSEYPVYSVWIANQVENAPAVDQSLGAEQGMVLPRDELVEVRRLPADLFSYLCAVAGGASLGDAMTAASFDEAGLLRALRFQFAESLVVAVG